LTNNNGQFVLEVPEAAFLHRLSSSVIFFKRESRRVGCHVTLLVNSPDSASHTVSAPLLARTLERKVPKLANVLSFESFLTGSVVPIAIELGAVELEPSHPTQSSWRALKLINQPQMKLIAASLLCGMLGVEDSSSSSLQFEWLVTLSKANFKDAHGLEISSLR
jgi:hypothetical protein